MVTVQVWITQPKFNVFKFGRSHVSRLEVIQSWRSVDKLTVLDPADEVATTVPAARVSHVIVKSVVDEEESRLGCPGGSLQKAPVKPEKLKMGWGCVTFSSDCRSHASGSSLKSSPEK